MSYLLGAYPAAPPTDPWDAAAEAEFLAALAASPLVDGFELPCLPGGRLHRADEDWLLRQLPAAGRHVVTAVPVTASRARTDPAYGLASTEAAGRAAAVADIAAAREAVERLVQHAGHPAVRAVEVHAAPGGTRTRVAGTAPALAASLEEIAGWDWCGARPLLEHCDAAGGPHDPDKGYLPLAAEIEAVAGLPVGIVVNWGRSVIEGRSVATAPAHVATLAAKGLLAGIVFSGVTDDPAAPHGAWADAHLPPRPAEPRSLLDAAAMTATLAATPQRPDILGVKLAAASGEHSPADRAAGLLAALALLDTAATRCGS